VRTVGIVVVGFLVGSEREAPVVAAAAFLGLVADNSECLRCQFDFVFVDSFVC